MAMYIIEGKKHRVTLISEAADHEKSMDIHPITHGEVLPARELYGEMLYREGQIEEAKAAFEASLKRTPNRRYAINGVEVTVAEL